MSWFEDWFNSPYYDKLYQSHNEQEAHSFINNLIARFKPAAGSKVADIPCGKGRYSRYLAQADLDVYGFDLSEKNIIEASKYEGPKLHFATHDMRQPFHLNYFDYILNIFTSLGYFESDRSDIRVLKNFHAALKPGGRLVIDFFNTDYVIKHFKKQSAFQKENVLFTISKEYDGRSIQKKIEVEDNGKVYKYTEIVRAYTLADFEKMLTKAGMTLTDTFGNYQLDKFENNISERLIIIAEKNNS